MLIVSLVLGLLFIGIAFLITPSNADTLLSGYNTMSDAQKAEFPLEDYLKAFKNFHIRFGVFFTFASCSLWFINQEWIGYANKRLYRLGSGVLVVTLIFILGLFIWSERDSTAVLKKDGLSINGAYGLDIAFNEMDSIALLSELPEIRTRLHGISTGAVSKGKYKGATSDIRYHLVIEHPTDLILAVYRTTNIPVFVALEAVSEQQLYNDLQAELDQL
jgi:hypothetical protein